MNDHYDSDLYAWSQRQAELLRRRAANELDWNNIAEEIESVGASEKREIRARLEVLCQHLLKWKYQPEHRSNSWRASIFEQRQRLLDVLEESPSLRAYPATVLAKSYSLGRRKAELETSLLHLPADCPWPIEQIISPEFWPD